MSNLQHKFLQIIKGAGVVGRTQHRLLRALGVPKHLLPASLKLIAQGIQASDECFGKITIITQLIKLMQIETVEITNQSLSEYRSHCFNLTTLHSVM